MTTRPTPLPRRKPPVFPGDFTDGLSVTETLAALPPGVPVAVKQTGHDTIPLAAFRGRARYQPSTAPQPAPVPAAAPEPDCAMFVLLPDGTPGLLCGIDRRRTHFDPETRYARRQFAALRASARAAGWWTDAYGRWCCPRCAADPSYTTPRPVVHYSEGAADARLKALNAGQAGDRAVEAMLLDIEYWRRVHKENVIARDVNGSAQAGKHRRTVTP